MPQPIPSMSSAGNWFSGISGWAHNLLNPPPAPVTNFFQTRITRTPGGIGVIDPNMAAAYQRQISPIDQVASSNLPTDQKQQLMQSWQRINNGFVTAAPDAVQRPDVMRHEQLHALWQNANLLPHAAGIAARVDPSVVDLMKNSPVYQQEMKWFGPTETIGDEGAAIDLISLANRAGGPSTGLHDYIANLLAKRPQYAQQFNRLTAPQ